jgi:hypothetical protein
MQRSISQIFRAVLVIGADWLRQLLPHEFSTSQLAVLSSPRRLLKNPLLEKSNGADAPLLASRRPSLGKGPQKSVVFAPFAPLPGLERDFFSGLLGGNR